MKMTDESASMMLFGPGTGTGSTAGASSGIAGGSASRVRTSGGLAAGHRVVSAGVKRAREDDDDRHRSSSMMDAGDGELNVDMLDVDIDGFDWDRDMSPVKKKARPSQPS